MIVTEPDAVTPAGGTLHEALDRLAEKGHLRWLGPTFARFLAALDVGSGSPVTAPVLLAAALLTEFEGRGHVCMDINDLLADPGRVLAWPEACWPDLAAATPGMPASAAGWVDRLAACSHVHVCDAGAADGGQPLVLDGHLLYLRRYWNSERRLAASVAQRVHPRGEPDAARARAWLDRLFPSDQPHATAAGEPDLQKVACAIALRGRLSIITGGPGTGKTYTVARLLALLLAMADEPGRLRIAMAAPTGKAATRMKESIAAAIESLASLAGDDLPLATLAAHLPAAVTLHSLLGVRPDSRQWRHHADHLLDVDVLVVDEASMVHLEMMTAVFDALPPQATLILLGDKDQLASVEAGAVLGDLCAHAHECRYDAGSQDWVRATTGQALPPALAGVAGNGTALDQQVVMLQAAHRFNKHIAALARAINADDVAAARASFAAGPKALAWIATACPDDVGRLAREGRAHATGGYSGYLAKVAQWSGGAAGDDAARALHAAWVREVLHAFDRFRILCAVRDGEWGVDGVNRRLETMFDAAGLLRCRGEWYLGRPVMVTRNDHALKVYNGDVGVTLPDPEQPGVMRVYFASGGGARGILATRLSHVETAYAMTVHKSQGSEFGHVVVVLPHKPGPVATRELLYTGVTRARDFFTLVTASPELLDATVRQQTRRASGLRAMLER